MDVVHQLITPENSDYLTANLNESFDVLGLNKDVYLVRKQLKEGLVSRKVLKILKYLHTPEIQVEISFKNHRLFTFVKKEFERDSSQNTQSTEQLNSKNLRFENSSDSSIPENSSKEDPISSNLISQNSIQNKTKKVISNDEIKFPTKSIFNLNNTNFEKKINDLDELNQINKESLDSKLIEDIDQLERLQKQTKTDLEPDKRIIKESIRNLNEKLDTELDKEFNKKDENLKSDENKENLDQEGDNLDEAINSVDNTQELNGKVNNLLNEGEKKDTDKTPSLNFNQDHHYVKMNNIESSSSDSSFNNQAESSYLCTLPPEKSHEMNFYLEILRSILGELVVDRLPENVVAFLKVKLLISVHLCVFIVLIGIIWFISYFITLIYHSIDNKTKLKNQICDLQNQLSVLKNEKQLVKKSQIKNKEIAEERNKLEKTIDDLLDEKVELESKITELGEELNGLKELNSKIQDEKEHLTKDLKEEMLSKRKFELNLNKKLKSLEDELNALNNYCDELKKKKEKGDKTMEEQLEKIENLNKNLNQLKDLTNEKDNQIEYLNRIYNELKNSKMTITSSNAVSAGLEEKIKIEITDRPEDCQSEYNQLNQMDPSNQFSQSIQIDQSTQIDPVNHQELTKLQSVMEKVKKERDEFKSKIEEYRSKVNNLEDEISKFDEFKCKLMNEKEEAERYTEFSKRYLKEKEDELAVELQSMKDELEQVKKLLLDRRKHSSSCWKENQTLKNELSLMRRDNEQLRKQIFDLIQDDNKQNKIPMPPEMPPELLSYLRYAAASPTASIKHPLSPSNHSQISDFYHHQNIQNHSNSLSHHPLASFTASPTHSLTNLSLRSTTNEPINSTQQTSPKNLNNYSYVYPNSNHLQYSPSNLISSTNPSPPSSSNLKQKPFFSSPLQNLNNTNDSINWSNQSNAFKPN